MYKKTTIALEEGNQTNNLKVYLGSQHYYKHWEVPQYAIEVYIHLKIQDDICEEVQSFSRPTDSMIPRMELR